MTQPPIVSVLMSVYNAEPYLAQAIDSILNQTLTEFEFIIINDGSTDRSLAILQEYAAKDDRIRFVSRENQGLTRTLNEMLALAEAELIARMDADDIAMPDRLAYQVQFLQQHPEVVCLGGSHELIDDKGRPLIYCTVPDQDADIQRLLLGGTSPICHPCVMMRRAAVLQVGGYDETFKTSQDLDLFLRLGEKGKLANSNEICLLKFRMHPRSVSHQRIEQQRQDASRACEAAWKRRGIEGQFVRKTWATDTDRPSLHHFLIQCGWSMFNNGYRSAAISYGIRTVATLPWNREGWVLLVCALVKPLPKPEPV